MTTYKRGGSWYFRFWSRKRLFETGGFRSKRRAMEAEWERWREVEASSKGRAPAPILFAAALDRYVDEVVSKHARPEPYKYKLLRGYFGGKALSSITPADIKEFTRWRVANPISGRVPKDATINRDLAGLSALFTWAGGEGVGLVPDGFNPAASGSVKRGPEPWRPWIVLTAEVEAKLWRLLPERERAQVQLFKNLGVRRGAVLGLQWEQIDFRNRLAHYTSKGKSAVIPLNKTAIAILEGLGPKPAGPVFPGNSDIALRRAWDKARKELGLPTLRMHDLRVTFARQLHEAGVPLKTIQALLGHSTPEMTLRYIPTDLNDQRRAVDLLDP